MVTHAQFAMSQDLSPVAYYANKTISCWKGIVPGRKTAIQVAMGNFVGAQKIISVARAAIIVRKWDAQTNQI